jgi:hypothetical protein
VATREAKPGSRTAGIRTFAISGLLGGVTGAGAQSSRKRFRHYFGDCLRRGFATYANKRIRAETRADGTFSATTAI